MIQERVRNYSQLVHNEIDEKINDGPVVELVDTCDSKSHIFGCGSSSLPGATTFYRLVVFGENSFPDNSLKGYAANHLSQARKEIEGLGERVRNDQILESDLFFLKRYMQRDFVLLRFKYKFEIVSDC